MEKVVISGGTGGIGSRLVLELLVRGYEVIVLTRDAKGLSGNDKLRYVTWLDGSGSWKDEINGASALINLAGAIIGGKRWTKSYKEAIYNSRIDSTRLLVDAINSSVIPTKMLYSMSAIGIYGDSKEARINEESPTGEGFLPHICTDWEGEASKVGDSTRLVIGRTGVVLDKHFGAMPLLLNVFRKGIGGPLGSGRQWFSWIHLDDIVAMILQSIKNDDMNGVYNFVSPNPVRNKVFAKTLGKVLRKPALFPVPEFTLKLMYGESASAVLEGQRVFPERLEKMGFNFKFPLLKDALEEVIS